MFKDPLKNSHYPFALQPTNSSTSVSGGYAEGLCGDSEYSSSQKNPRKSLSSQGKSFQITPCRNFHLSSWIGDTKYELGDEIQDMCFKNLSCYGSTSNSFSQLFLNLYLISLIWLICFLSNLQYNYIVFMKNILSTE